MARDVNHRAGGPVGFVVIKGILANLAIIGHQSLVVPPRRVTFVTTGNREIKHVPNELAPKERSRLHRLPISFVKKILVFLGMIITGLGGFSHRLLAVLVNAGTGAIFTYAKPSFRIFRMDLVKPGAKFSECAIIPAKILVEGIQLGAPIGWFAVTRIGGGSGRTRGVFLGGKLGQLADEADRLGAGLHGNLIEHAPANHRRMIVALPDELDKLLFGVGVKSGRFGDAIYERDLGPENNPILICQLISMIIVFVVRQTNSRSSKLFQQYKVRISDRKSVV